ncbi:hypothetical protein IMG5_204060 [Ichthyophthirius multifiliis]|uniref:Uncharacterized protein n=1 Tax=Ichthyophthirius multifiliis TaxID=5932 RepID=G0R6E7_ICHMU|nr:hypothetical protein IMG5_204060 [Ichthyophthirius multifiliis]EGR26955.1 hypothetical protein IMG5_204060 [Ichthyophthirius multifiliis]|eukprot:XP_004023839.1 hypothetical protein IMG5_204060 [Ichthyophthirius multifiliis]
MNKQRVLQILEHESQNWINEKNLNKINQETIIPSTVFNETEYYLKLHEQAYLYEQGRFKDLEEATLEQPEIQYKNSLIMPIYQEVVSLVKYLKNTESYKLEKEFQVAKKILKDDLTNNNQENLIQEKLVKLEKAFQKLRNELKKKQEQPDNQIEFLHQHLLILYNLLRKWSEYTTIVKMPNAAVRSLIEQKKGRAKGEQVIKKKDELCLDEDNEEDLEMNKDDENFAKPKDISQEEDNIQSNDEKVTSESEDEIDIKKLIDEEKEREEQVKKQKQEFMDKIQKLQQDKENKEKNQENQDNQEIILDQEQIIQNLIKQFEKTADDQLQQEFNIDQISSLYDNKDKADQQEYFKGLDLENIFPRVLLDTAFQFDKIQHLEYQNVEQALKAEEKIDLIKGDDPNQSPRKFETSLIVEVFKERSTQLRQQVISRPNQIKLNDIDTLLDLIGEIRVQESEFLLRIWNNF